MYVFNIFRKVTTLNAIIRMLTVADRSTMLSEFTFKVVIFPKGLQLNGGYKLIGVFSLRF